jgi:hypothetical protein
MSQDFCCLNPRLPGSSNNFYNRGCHDDNTWRQQPKRYNDRAVNFFANAAPDKWLSPMPGVQGQQSSALRATQEIFQKAGHDTWIDRNEALGLLRRSRRAADELNGTGNGKHANVLNQYGNVFEAINEMYTGKRAFNQDYIKQAAESIGTVMTDNNLNKLG